MAESGNVCAIMGATTTNERAMMNLVIPITKEQLIELADQIQEDKALWGRFVDLELDTEKRLASAAAQGRWIDDPDVVLEPLKQPSMDALALDFLDRRYGAGHNLNRWSLIVEVRRRVRLHLGLPV